MYTDTEILKKYARACELDLSGAELLADADAVRRDCNGIGAEWMGEYLRGRDMYDDIKALVLMCVQYKLSGREILFRYSPAQLAGMYNGAGPDSWIPEARAVLTDAMALFKAAVLIHDVQFAHSDGSDAGFLQASSDWIVNTGKILRAEFPLFTWRMLSRSYRLNMAYWTSVKYMADAAISGPAAKRAWIAAYNNKKQGVQK